VVVVLQQDLVDAASQVLTTQAPQGNQDGGHAQMDGQIHLFKECLRKTTTTTTRKTTTM